MPFGPSPFCSPVGEGTLTRGDLRRRPGDLREAEAQLLRPPRIEAPAVAVRGVQGVVVGPSRRPVVASLRQADDRVRRRPANLLDRTDSAAACPRPRARRAGRTPRPACPSRRRRRAVATSCCRVPGGRPRCRGSGKRARSCRPSPRAQYASFGMPGVGAAGRCCPSRRRSTGRGRGASSASSRCGRIPCSGSAGPSSGRRAGRGSRCGPVRDG